MSAMKTVILHDYAVDDALEEAQDYGLNPHIHPFGVMVEDLARLAVRHYPGSCGDAPVVQSMANLSPTDIADILRRTADTVEEGGL